MESNVQVITIGRAASNTVVINESNVSSVHAQITIAEEEMVLEDLGSTNGTSVGKVENKINRSIIQHGDTVFLGSIPYLVKDLLGQANSNLPNAEAVSSASAKPSPNQPNVTKPALHGQTRWNPAVVAIVGSLCLLLIAGSWIWWNGSNSDEDKELATNSQKQISSNNKSEAIESKADSVESKNDKARSKSNGPKIRDNVENKETKLTQEPTALSEAEILNRSLYLVVCSDTNNETPFRVGTAFAIDSNHLATSASVIKTIENLKTTGFPNVTFVNPVMNQDLEMVATRIHHRYRSANADALKAQQEHDQILDDLGPSPSPDDVNKVKPQLLDTRKKAINLFELQTTCDAGIITVNQTLEHWIKGAEPDSMLRPKMKLNVTGFSIDNEDGFFDKSATNASTSMPCRVKQVSKWTDESFRILEATGTAIQRENSFAGSPVINEQGHVVAIYSRPVPIEDETNDVTQITAFDAPLFLRVRECLENLP